MGPTVGPGSVRVRLGLLVGFGLVMTGCSVGPAGPAPSPTPGSPSPDGLTIVVDDGSGAKTTWQLSCDPPGGTHPDPEAACRTLQAHGGTALPAVPKDRICTQIYGGAQTATVSGRWQGRTVRSSFSLRNGCEIARWKMLVGLLPPVGA